MASSKTNSSSAPFSNTIRRRTILACSNCRKRKIRCITTEQPPSNPCARCTKKNIPCEYVAAAEPEYYPAERPQTPNPDRGHSRMHSSSAPRPMKPSMPANFSSGREAAPPLPYTGPPPIVMTPTGWAYVAPSRRGPSSAYVNPRTSTPVPGPNQPYAHSQYHVPGHPTSQHTSGYNNPQFDPQPQYPPSQPPFTQPQSGDDFDYNTFLNNYDGSKSQSSRWSLGLADEARFTDRFFDSSYPFSNNPGYPQ
ncbi:hypothetical protein B0H17DRAFT_1260061 [Mycena rosella]|uniref:Zn(2)-C6 fungal-type domain-containing protein n=1 Tax=Mycena rosella TaxID=1033263 RepID=A0AAD7DRT0_MYCRO|nr:hypothetical protein B0H17DRAFT_1260061 [Mycena rosella]